MVQDMHNACWICPCKNKKSMRHVAIAHLNTGTTSQHLQTFQSVNMKIFEWRFWIRVLHSLNFIFAKFSCNWHCGYGKNYNIPSCSFSSSILFSPPLDPQAQFLRLLQLKYFELWNLTAFNTIRHLTQLFPTPTNKWFYVIRKVKHRTYITRMPSDPNGKYFKHDLNRS
mgnify:CR=1 FL=1